MWMCANPLASHAVAMIQLSEEEKERYKGVHVFLDFDSGFYTLPVSLLFLCCLSILSLYWFIRSSRGALLVATVAS